MPRDAVTIRGEIELVGGPGDGNLAVPDVNNPWVLKWTDLSGKVHDYLLDERPDGGIRRFRWAGNHRRVVTRRVGRLVFWRVK